MKMSYGTPAGSMRRMDAFEKALVAPEWGKISVDIWLLGSPWGTCTMGLDPYNRQDDTAFS